MKNTSKIINTLVLCDDALDKKVRIAGTDFDRKRRYKKEDLKKARRMLKSGKTFSEISKKTGITYHALRYNLDEAYRTYYNAHRDGSHVGKDHITKQDRVAYKRSLVASGALAV